MAPPMRRVNSFCEGREKHGAWCDFIPFKPTIANRPRKMRQSKSSKICIRRVRESGVSKPSHGIGSKEEKGRRDGESNELTWVSFFSLSLSLCGNFKATLLLFSLVLSLTEKRETSQCNAEMCEFDEEEARPLSMNL